MLVWEIMHMIQLNELLKQANLTIFLCKSACLKECYFSVTIQISLVAY